MSLSSISRGSQSSRFTIAILIANSEWIKTITKIEYHHIYLVHRRAKGSFWSVGVLKFVMLQSLGVGSRHSHLHQRHRNHHLSQSRTKRRMRRVPNWHRLCVSPSPVSTMPSPPPPSPSTKLSSLFIITLTLFMLASSPSRDDPCVSYGNTHTPLNKNIPKKIYLYFLAEFSRG